MSSSLRDELLLEPRIESDEPRSEAEPALEAEAPALEADVARLSAAQGRAMKAQDRPTSHSGDDRREWGGWDERKLDHRTCA